MFPGQFQTCALGGVGALTLWLWYPLLTIALWWLSTVGIIFLCGRYAWRKWALGISTVLAGAALAAMPILGRDPSHGGAVWALVAGLVAWGWIEVTYYTGAVVGQDVPPCPEGCAGWTHFTHGVRANIHHELLIIGLFAAVYVLHVGAENRIALWTVTILWWMHQSAKINIFLGVRNLNEEYLPEHLRHLARYFNKRPMNLFFPVSVTVSTAVAHWLFFRARTTADAFEAVTASIGCTMMALAILEHWWLILPQPVGLWAWGLMSRTAQSPKPTVDVVCGFLGSGKTTFIKQLVPQLGEKTVVLVNEMGEIGLDGRILREEANGAAGVVELPKGCICCTLQRDLVASLARVIREFEPERIILEPSGVAAISEVLGTLYQPGCRDLLGTVRVVTVLDGPRWLDAAGDIRSFMRAQVRAAATTVVNKCDTLDQAELATIKEDIRRLNPDARLVTTSFGRVRAEALSDTTEDAALGDELERRPNFDSFGTNFDGRLDPAALKQLFEELETGEFGDLARAKGVFETESGWLRIEYAGRTVRTEPCAPMERSSLTVIGGELKTDRLRDAVRRCLERPAPDAPDRAAGSCPVPDALASR